jgi:hypothetical protein
MSAAPVRARPCRQITSHTIDTAATDQPHLHYSHVKWEWSLTIRPKNASATWCGASTLRAIATASCKSGSAASNAVVQCIGGGVEQEGEILVAMLARSTDRKICRRRILLSLRGVIAAPCIWSCISLLRHQQPISPTSPSGRFHPLISRLSRRLVEGVELRYDPMLAIRIAACAETSSAEVG